MQDNLANGTMSHTDWNSIDWNQANRVVRNLRQRIFKATQTGDYIKVRQLQKLMLRNYSNTLVSVRRVTQVNAGKYTYGVDKVIVKTPEARSILVDEIQQFQPWKTQPARRVYIPKSNGKQRPLGIPTVLDRVHQARVKNALEPEWEAKFEGISYGFRPGRGCHDAIMAIYGFSRPNKKKKWVVDADIKGAFDNIDHEFLLNAIGNFPARQLIKKWLKSGYVDKNVFHDTEAGTPQGGIISPLLANIALHGMEDALKIKRANSSGVVVGTRGVVRYADDFVVFCETKEDAEKSIFELHTWLAERGLALSEEKTKIVHLSEGFDFLGFNVRLYNRPSTPTGYKLLIKPSKKSVQAFKDRLKTEWMSLRGANATAVIHRLNPIIRGWANYYRIGNSVDAFKHLDMFMFLRAVRWAKRQHPGRSWKYITQKYWRQWNKQRKDNWVFGDEETGFHLCKFTWVNIKRHVMVKGKASMDDPSLNGYWLKREAKKASSLAKHLRIIAASQGYICPVCKQSISNGEEIHDHHLITDRNNPDRNLWKNRRILHLYCHQQVHSSKNRNNELLY